MSTKTPIDRQGAAIEGPDEPPELAGGARLRRRLDELEGQERLLGEELSSVLASVDAGIITLDATGAVRSQNETAVEILGGPVEDLSAVFGPFCEGPQAIDPPVPSTATELQLVDQPDRWLEMIRHAWRSEDTAEVVVIRDVTESRQSRGLRDALLGMLSHELRTPVTSIYAAAELLRSDGTSLGADERAGLIDDIGEESERLLRLVDDLLVLSHFDEGIKLVQEPSLLQHVVPAVLDRERRRWPEIDISLRVLPDLPVVVGDETSVQQVVRNLISNACKYGGGEPVEVELVEGDEPGAIVRVLDRGPGLTPEESEALFRPFFRSTRTPRASSGAGIGLYVCRCLVDAMGGHIWARPRARGGSEFGFWLPEYDHESDDGFAPGGGPTFDATLMSFASGEVHADSPSDAPGTDRWPPPKHARVPPS